MGAGAGGALRTEEYSYIGNGSKPRNRSKGLYITWTATTWLVKTKKSYTTYQEYIYCHFGMHAIAATVDKYSYMHASNRIGSDLSLCDDNDKICIFVRYDN